MTKRSFDGSEIDTNQLSQILSDTVLVIYGRLKKRDFYHFFGGKGGGQQVHFIFFSLSRNDF